MDLAFYAAMTWRYIQAMLPGAILALALFFLLRPFRMRRLAGRGLSSSLRREAVLLLLYLFSGGMAALTLLPSDWVNPLVNLIYGVPLGPFFSLGSVNLNLFATLELGHQTRFTIFILLGNIIMFIPFGFFAALLWRGFTWKRVLVLGLCITAFIECWQLCIGRAFDIDDLLFNALGVLCGYGLWRLLERAAPAFAGRFQVQEKSVT